MTLKERKMFLAGYVFGLHGVAEKLARVIIEGPEDEETPGLKRCCMFTGHLTADAEGNVNEILDAVTEEEEGSLFSYTEDFISQWTHSCRAANIVINRSNSSDNTTPQTDGSASTPDSSKDEAKSQVP